ncbi:MAG: hypothetical protein NTY80_02865 [candidate division SR1 bacterium]|nr:hypothetical protein [candidate division SR1 bacterium]
MFLVFTLVLLVVAVGILVSVYSVFFPFLQNLGTVTQYHMAYYGAVSSVERAELGLRYRAPGFVGTGGFLGSTGYGPISDYTPEILSGDYQGFRWKINSRTTSIPALGMGNTDPMISNLDSKDYNQIGYTNLETLLLSYDVTTNPEEYYSGITNLSFFSGDDITGVFRLPPKVHTLFGDTAGLLCDSYVGNDCDPDADGIFNDIALSWSLEGKYQGNGFKIYPSLSVFYYSGMQVDERKDNAIRESLINTTGIIAFDVSSPHSFSPVDNGFDLTQHTVVGPDANYIEGQTFHQILTSTDFSGLRLSFGAANLFRTFTGTIYPYLEYQFTFSQPIADRFYTIEGHGRVGEYDVQIVLKKPTVQGTVGGDFTVIF